MSSLAGHLKTSGNRAVRGNPGNGLVVDPEQRLRPGPFRSEEKLTRNCASHSPCSETQRGPIRKDRKGSLFFGILFSNLGAGASSAGPPDHEPRVREEDEPSLPAFSGKIERLSLKRSRSGGGILLLAWHWVSLSGLVLPPPLPSLEESPRVNPVAWTDHRGAIPGLEVDGNEVATARKPDQNAPAVGADAAGVDVSGPFAGGGWKVF